jgi:YHS domain-containing protein
MFVHYDPTSGQIRQVSQAPRPFRLAGQAVALVDPAPEPRGRWAVDLKSLRPAAIDPVCGAVLDPARAKRSIEHEGTTYRFCCDACAVKFFLDPSTVLADRAAPDEAWECCSLVALPPDPPDAREVKAARNAELAATDAMMVADRPLAGAVREEWRAYRQALRDIGSCATAAEMIAAWPKRPGGGDGPRILELRGKLAAAAPTE